MPSVIIQQNYAAYTLLSDSCQDCEACFCDTLQGIKCRLVFVITRNPVQACFFMNVGEESNNGLFSDLTDFVKELSKGLFL